MGRILNIAGVALVGLFYVWVAAVGNLGRVRAAKRARRFDAGRSTH
jgi:hypothetical protein